MLHTVHQHCQAFHFIRREGSRHRQDHGHIPNSSYCSPSSSGTESAQSTTVYLVDIHAETVKSANTLSYLAERPMNSLGKHPSCSTNNYPIGQQLDHVLLHLQLIRPASRGGKLSLADSHKFDASNCNTHQKLEMQQKLTLVSPTSIRSGRSPPGGRVAPRRAAHAGTRLASIPAR